MSNEIVKKDDLDSKKYLIKRTICKDSTDDELELFLHSCKKTGLDPLMKQIHAVKRGGVMTIQTGIDGLRLIADRTGRYSPGRQTSFEYGENKAVVSATAYIKKMTPDGTWHEISATAYMSEYKPSSKSPFWESKPHVMLGKCAEAIALRKAFPAEMSGVYADDEMAQADVQKEDKVVTISSKRKCLKDEMTYYVQSMLMQLEEIIDDEGFEEEKRKLQMLERPMQFMDEYMRVVEEGQPLSVEDYIKFNPIKKIITNYLKYIELKHKEIPLDCKQKTA